MKKNKKSQTARLTPQEREIEMAFNMGNFSLVNAYAREMSQHEGYSQELKTRIDKFRRLVDFHWGAFAVGVGSVLAAIIIALLVGTT